MKHLVAAVLMTLGMTSSLMAQDMPITQVLVDGKGWELVGEGYGFTEGPAVDAAGNVFFTDIPNDRIYKIDLAGNVGVFVEN